MANGLASSTRSPLHLAAGVALIAGLIAGSGCAGQRSSVKESDPKTVIDSGEASVESKVVAVDELWSRRASISRTEAREEIKNIVWSSRHAMPVRQRAVEVLLADAEDKDQADTRTSLALRLPQENNPDMVKLICDLAAERRWVEFASPAVRSWARRMGSMSDDDRGEKKLLETLSGKPAVAALFDVFAVPVAPEARGPEAVRAEKTRRAAWQVLVRVDPAGDKRADLMRTIGPSTDPLIEDIRALGTEFGVVPRTDSELSWLGELRRFDAPGDGAARRQWWAEARGAVAALSEQQRQGLRMRHFEPVRWATNFKPEWVKASRQRLLAILAERLAPRRVVARQGASGALGGDESLVKVQGELGWGDVLAALVIDEALSTTGLAPDLWAQLLRDQADTSTEYGGLLEFASGRFVANLYPPRPTQRAGDNRFVASDDMMKNGTWALAHYHFHAQRIENADYAGPGPGDAEFANEHGKNCLVITPTKDGVMNVDYFISGGTTLDLGLLTRSGERK